MPTVTIVADELFALLGKTYTDDEITDISMNFGVEVDDIEQNTEGKKTYKFDVAANRYDLLCVEGLARALRLYLALDVAPVIKTVTPINPLVLNQDASTLPIRPFVVAAVLRNVNMTQAVYNSFIDLQDKLHFNIGRRRTLVSIGTHDLDNIRGPFIYTAKPYDQIEFTALSETQRMNVTQLFNHYKNKEVCHLKPFLDIAEQPQMKAGIPQEKWLHPVIMDANGEVLSLPPVINSEYSKISINTKNIFIEITATDFTKCNIVLNIITSLFSEHSVGNDKFTVESVVVNHPKNIPFPPGVDSILRLDAAKSTPSTKAIVYPNPVSTPVDVEQNFINEGLGLNLSVQEMCTLLNKMQLSTVVSGTKITVTPPPTRSDILHAVDIQEDVAIAYGYNNLPLALPKVAIIGAEEPLNQLSNHLRYAVAGCGYIEVMTWALIQTEENFEKIHKVDPTNYCVTLANSKTEFTACRTTLLPGLLKVLYSNQSFKLPFQIFELGDVIYQSKAVAEGAVNRRKLGVMYGGQTSGFEEVHGVLTRVMEQLRVPFIPYTTVITTDGKVAIKDAPNTKFTYTLLPIATDNTNHPFLPKRGANVVLYIKDDDNTYSSYHLGEIGVLHPTVLSNFDIGDIVVCSMFEIDIEPLL